MNFREALANIRKETALYVNNITAYIKYQLLTKAVLLFLIFPVLHKVGNMLIKASGQTVISSGNYKHLLSSLPLMVFFAVALLIFLLSVVIDINAFIIISASIKKTGKPSGLICTIKSAVKSVTSFFSPAGAFLALYTILAVPLVGIGVKTSLIKSLKIPNFITSVIYNTPLYMALYIAVLILLAIAGFFMILSFHFMYLHKDHAFSSIKNSAKTVWKSKSEILKTFVLLNVILVLITEIGLGVMYLSIGALDKALAQHEFFSRFAMLFVLFLCSELFNVWVFLVWPLQTHMLTGIFCKNTDADKFKASFGCTASEKPKRIKRKLKLIIALVMLMIFNLVGSTLCAYFFDELFHSRPSIEIVAHRAGGDLAAENTILGIDAAAAAGATWSEIDVMRSKDGVYVINHDATFSRLAGVSKAPSEMNWEEIKELKVKDEFNPERPAGTVPDLDSLMEASKGKIGLLIELKNPDADKKMADDVVEAIFSKQMAEEAMIISLDYDIIKYIEEKYPSIKTGYLYFFAIGDTSKINTDCLLMEESAVNLDIIEEIHNEGKTAFVWTVNNPEAINGLLDADVDGIITDRVVELNESVKKWDQKTDKDIILDEIKNIFANK